MNTGSFRIRNLVQQPREEPVPVPTTSIAKQTPKGPKAPKLKRTPPPPPQQVHGKKTRKEKISAALREQVWVQQNGQVFRAKCATTWCNNQITVFDFQCGHDIPESKGGPTNITNLYPICGKCNMSMSNTYTFKEWCLLYEAKKTPPAPPATAEQQPRRTFWSYFCCFQQITQH